MISKKKIARLAGPPSKGLLSDMARWLLDKVKK